MRNISLSRNEAEFLTDLLMLTDEYPSKDISEQIRDVFGMVSVEKELKALKTTLPEIRAEFAKKILTPISNVDRSDPRRGGTTLTDRFIKYDSQGRPWAVADRNSEAESGIKYGWQ